MPKQVDHQVRRQQIAEAVLRLAGTQGLDAVSLRHVATEAGVSMGQVQHYFATKDELLLFAFHAISERVERRLGAALTAVRSLGARSLLRALLIEMLPLSDQSRAEAPVLAAFLARAVVERRLAAPLREGGQGMTGFVAEQIRAAQQAGEISAELDPAREASILLAFVDGMMMHLLIRQIDTSAALAMIDYKLDHIFTDNRTGQRTVDRPAEKDR